MNCSHLISVAAALSKAGTVWMGKLKSFSGPVVRQSQDLNPDPLSPNQAHQERRWVMF